MFTGLVAFIVSFKEKVKVAMYNFVHRGVPVREDTYPEPSANEVGWPVSFPCRLYLGNVATRYPFAIG